MPKYINYIFSLALATLTSSYSSAEETSEKLRSINRPDTSNAQLSNYANDSNWKIRKSVASRQSTPADLLIKLSADPDYRVRAAVAHNLKAPRKALLPLVNDNSPDVRLSLAHCGYTPPDILDKLVTDPDPGVRKQLIENPNLSLRTLRDIAEGGSENAMAADIILRKRQSEE